MSDVLAGFKITSSWIPNTNAEFPNADAWRVRVTNPRGEVLQRQYFMGYGHKGAKPKLVDFMESMISDAECVEYVSEEGFAADLGYEYDTREEVARVHRIYTACERIRVRLEKFLTPEEREAFTVAARGE